jgi:hypothetical protein
MRKRTKLVVGVVGTLGLIVGGGTLAWAVIDVRSEDGTIDNADATHHHHLGQHGGGEGHLPAGSSGNIQLVSKLALKNVEPGKIADVGVHNGYAYLAAWGGETCKYNGVHVVDIRNPAAPKEVSFIQAKEGSAPGEGVQALSISTPSFTGDILVTNNETCNEKTGFGGLNIYNVTKAANPTVLTEGFGDETVNGQGKKKANEIHSVFAWQAGNKAYAVIVDNDESADVDILDISNPRKPVIVREYDLAAEFPQILQAAPANLNQVFFHDMVVKKIGSRYIMLASYWDAGYVKFDVTDPANAFVVADSDFATVDPELLAQAGLSEAPEGNAHQAEFTKDNAFILASDEDFGPTGFDATTDDGGKFFAIPGDTTPRVDVGTTLSGQTRYAGLACPTSPAVPTGNGTQIAVISRGDCTFTEKVATVQAAGGYRAVIVVNREGGDACGAFAMAVEGGIPAVSVDRATGYGLFDLAGYDNAACAVGSALLLPGVAVGATGDTVGLRSFFDGWGYVHLYRNDAGGKLTELDTWAIPEAMNPANATGKGDLSVHEVATSSVDAKLAYFSYYSGGFRVAKINASNKIEQVGHFIDEGGNNFWGVQTFMHNGEEYVAASDRDFGLYIFKYNGGA